MSTVIHATHEAVRKVGGIGTVLEGLVTSPSYQKAIERTFLVGPLTAASDEGRIAREGKVLYSSITGVTGGAVGRPAGVWLSEDERAALEWAAGEGGGYLGIADLAGLLGLSTWKARRLAGLWEGRGWFEKDPQSGNKRKLTQVGLSLVPDGV